MKHLLRLLRSIAAALQPGPPPRRYQVATDGRRRDAAAQRADFARVGNDLRAVLKRDQQAYERAKQGERRRPHRRPDP